MIGCRFSCGCVCRDADVCGGCTEESSGWEEGEEAQEEEGEGGERKAKNGGGSRGRMCSILCVICSCVCVCVRV